MFAEFFYNFKKGFYKVFNREKYLDLLEYEETINYFCIDLLEKWDEIQIDAKAVINFPCHRFVFKLHNQIIATLEFNTYHCLVCYNDYNLFIGGKLIKEPFKKRVYEMICSILFNNEYPSCWHNRCEVFYIN